MLKLNFILLADCLAVVCILFGVYGLITIGNNSNNIDFFLLASIFLLYSMFLKSEEELKKC